MRYLRLHTLGFAALLVAITVIHCAPTETQADRRRRWTTYGSDRGRLVVACDMRSDTCSDGRRITTTRATPVPCETSPGVWEMVPENTGCYSVRGLESWAQTTSYLSWGAQLDNPAWSSVQGGTVEVLPDGYRIHPAPGSANSGVVQVNLDPIPAEGETRTLACIVRTHRPAYIRYWLSSSQSASFPVIDTGARWEVLAATRTLPEAAGSLVRIGNGPASENPVPFDVAGCWLTKSDTPGRPCWGGEAPVTCAGDRHTISTEGWPTESGEISVVFEVGALEGSPRYIIDGRVIGGGPTHSILMIDSSGRLRFDIVAGTPNLGPAVPPGKHHVRLRWGDGRTQVFLDGAQVMDIAGTPTWHEAAYLGSRFASPYDPLQGSISSLRVRSFE